MIEIVQSLKSSFFSPKYPPKLYKIMSKKIKNKKRKRNKRKRGSVIPPEQTLNAIAVIYISKMSLESESLSNHRIREIFSCSHRRIRDRGGPVIPSSSLASSPAIPRWHAWTKGRGRRAPTDGRRCMASSSPASAMACPSRSSAAGLLGQR